MCIYLGHIRTQATMQGDDNNGDNVTRRTIHDYIGSFAFMLNEPKYTRLPLTVRLHSALQQTVASSTFSGNDLIEANMSCKPPSRPIISEAPSDEEN